MSSNGGKEIGSDRGEALESGEQLYRTMFENIQEGVSLRRIVYDQRGEIVDVVLLDANPAALQIYGAGSIDELKGKRYGDMATPGMVAAALGMIRQMMAIGKSVTSEQFAEVNGRYYQVTTTPLGDDRFITMSVDITERKRAEEALRESEARYRNILETAQEGVMISDLDGRIIFANERMARLLGYSVSELVGSKGIELVPEDMQRELAAKVRAREEGFGETYEVWMRRKDGGEVCLLASGSPVQDAQGKHTANLGMYVDITERKLTERLVEESAERARQHAEEIQAIMDAAPAAIWVAHDPECRVITGNKVADSFYESKEEENVSAGPTTGDGWDKTRRFFKDGRELKPEELPMQKATLKGVEIRNSELEVVLPSGRRIDMLGNAIPLFDEGGKVRGGVATFLDITERKRTEDDLKHSNAELQQFAYVASHDLQEPLRMVISHLSLLNKKYGDSLDPKAKVHMSTAIEGGERMRELVDDLLQYSRIDSQAAEFSLVDLNKVIEAVANNLQLAITESKCAIEVGTLPTVWADEKQMAQLFTNLVSNAIKFRAKEPPIIKIQARRNNEEHIFSVNDNGIGIDPQYHDRVFQMFQRLHTVDEYPGTGIGLALCKKIVERHGGHIWVESELGKGATFYFTMPR
jgi:PAS domain S-box-containing protein